MNRPVNPDKPVKIKPKPKATLEQNPPKRPRKPRAKKKIIQPVVPNLKHRLLWSSLEFLGLAISAVLAIMVILGYSADWISILSGAL